MDKQTIDYAIEKLNGAYAAIKPDAVELGQDMIEYMVFKTTVLAIAFSLLFLFCFIPFIISMYNLVTTDEEAWIPVGVVTVLGSFATGFGLAVAAHRTILAHMYPLMWTIEQLSK